MTANSNQALIMPQLIGIIIVSIFVLFILSKFLYMFLYLWQNYNAVYLNTFYSRLILTLYDLNENPKLVSTCQVHQLLRN